MTAVSTETPINASKPSADETLNGVWVELERDQGAYRLGQDDAEGDGHRKFEIAIKREQDHENDEHGKRADELNLVFGFKKFAILPTPFEPIPGGQGFLKIRNGPLSIEHGALQVAPLDAVLHADVA